MFVSFFLVLIEKTFCKLELAVQSLLESIFARNKEREVSLGFTHLDDVLV